MTSSNERQISICLRKYNLDEIENEFGSQLLSVLPYLQKEDQQLSLNIMHMWHEHRSDYTEQEHLKYTNGHLITKRVQIQREVNDLNKMAKEITEQYSDVEQLIEKEEIAMEQHASEYGTKLSEITNKCRQNANIYDEEMMKGETSKANKILSELLAEEKMVQQEIIELKQTRDNMNQDVADNMSAILGGTELEKKLNSLNNKYSYLKMKY